MEIKEKLRSSSPVIRAVPKTSIPNGWTTRRKNSMAMFILSYFLIGIEFTTILSTVWAYVNRGVQDGNPEVSYGLITSGRFVAPILFSIVISRWLDRTGSMKIIMLSVPVLLNVGYVVYLFHNSSLLPMLGTILQGFNFILRAAINSETIRVYSGDEVQRCVVLFMMANGIGEGFGPLMVKMLDRVDFWVGGLHIMYANVSALGLLLLNTIRIVLVYFYSYDVSKEFDLKVHELKMKESTTNDTASSEKSWFSAVRESFSLDATLLLIQQIYTGFIGTFIGRALPLVASSLNYSDFPLEACFIGTSLIMTFISMIMAAFNTSQKDVYLFGVISLLAFFVAHIALFLIPMGISEKVNIALVSTLVFTYAVSRVTDQTFIIVTLGKLFPSSIQSSIEGLQNLVHIVGSFLGSLASAYKYDNFFYVFFFSLPVTHALLVMLMVRRKAFTDPKVTEYERLK